MVTEITRVDRILTNELLPEPLYQTVQDCLTKAAAIDPPYIPTRIALPVPETVIKEEINAPQLAKLATILFRCHLNQQESVEQQLLFKTEAIIHQKQQESNRLLEAAQRLSHSNVWDYLKLIAGALLGTVSIIVGTTGIALGGPLGWTAGSLLIASGVSSITTTILAQLRVHPEVTSIIALVSAGLGLAGSVVSFFTIADSLTHLIAILANSAFTVASGTTTIGSEEMKRQLSELDFAIAHIKKDLALDDATVKQLSLQAMQIAETMYKDIRHCQIALAKQQQAMKRIISLQLIG
jgi:hypothetical protein